MKILFVAAEADPFAKVGGLADVAAGLPRRLHALGHDVRLLVPGHAPAERALAAASSLRELRVPCAGDVAKVVLAETTAPGGPPTWLVRDGTYFPRANVYGEPDDLQRYLFFCRTVAAILQAHDFIPDVLHVNDWHTAPLAFALRNLAWEDPALRQVVSVLTIHNLRYRGPDAFNDCLGQGIYYADAVTTVSPGYAREIVTPGSGEGLEELLQLRRPRLRGILNGLDQDHFDPATDPALDVPFDAEHLEARSAAAAAIRRELGIASDRPLATMIARLTEQKGVDLLIAAIPALVALDLDLFVLGNGDPRLETALKGLETAFPRQVRFSRGYDDRLGRRAYAAADMLLMPSRFEPCGLGQMIAMRYGCVPVGRRTGGLADTILDPDQYGEAATGYLFDDYDPAALVEAVRRALDGYSDQRWWRRLQHNGMTHDFSWAAPAEEYLQVYREAFDRRGLPRPAEPS